MCPIRYDRQTPRAPSAQHRPPRGVDPLDTTAEPFQRLIEGRGVITGLLVEHEKRRQAANLTAIEEDTLLGLHTPHNLLAAIELERDDEQIGEVGGREGDHWPWPRDDDPWQDDSSEEAANDDFDLNWSDLVGNVPRPERGILQRLVAETTTPKRCNQERPAGWPETAVYGQEHWPQLRWRQLRKLDDGQRRPDRFELGEWWWQCIYDDPQMNTEHKFHVRIAELQLKGVLWAAPGESGRLPNPAFARIVICGRRYRKVAVWTLALPKPGWSERAWNHFLHNADINSADRALIETCDAIDRQSPGLTSMIAAHAWLRRDQRRTRGGDADP
jgi:hypothetical protein